MSFKAEDVEHLGAFLSRCGAKDPEWENADCNAAEVWLISASITGGGPIHVFPFCVATEWFVYRLVLLKSSKKNAFSVTSSRDSDKLFKEKVRVIIFRDF